MSLERQRFLQFKELYVKTVRAKIIKMFVSRPCMRLSFPMDLESWLTQ